VEEKNKNKKEMMRIEWNAATPGNGEALNVGVKKKKGAG
jgi:hypothetical protein